MPEITKSHIDLINKIVAARLSEAEIAKVGKKIEQIMKRKEAGRSQGEQAEADYEI